MSHLLSNMLPFTPYPYLGERPECDLCGSGETVLICEDDRRLKKLRTVACRRCGVMRTDPMPTLDEVARYYSDTYRRDYGLTSGGPSRRHLTRSHRHATKRTQLLKPAMRPGARLLDFGSGAGVFLSHARAAGLEVTGVEPGREMAEHARSAFGVEVISDVWENVSLEGPYDIITTVEVLEHLRQPVKALRWLAGLLAEDGIIYVTVPNMLPNGMETFRRFHFAHLYHFTPTTLVWAGQACGLTVDPRFVSSGTRMVFRKDRGGPRPLTFDRNYGEALPAQYPRASVARHLLSGRWLVSAGRRARKTIRDTLAAPGQH